MNVIALDTASPLPTVALSAAGEVFEERLVSEGRASEDLLPALQRCLSRAGLALDDFQRIAVCAGPGSFTGARIGLASAWGLGSALGIPAEAVSTLEAMAEAVRESGAANVTTALDAGKGQIVLALFNLEEPRARALGEISRVGREEALRLAAAGDLFCLPPDLLAGARAPVWSPARALALASARAPREASAFPPRALYSRPSAAEEKRGAP
jgi:tRNA threonylcarbamoyl adenosine modification protein YeaZ